MKKACLLVLLSISVLLFGCNPGSGNPDSGNPGANSEIDDYYLEIHEYLHVVKDNSDVLHMYVTKPGDNGLIYIF